MEPPAVLRGGGEDLISGLPDELLHTILVRLPSAAAAARTSILSRRWRGVWAHMPELVLGGSPTPATTTSALLDSVDAALNSYSAPTLGSLEIDLAGIDRCAADRIAPWLRFASQRVAGKISLRLNLKENAQSYDDILEELALPICERATEIDLELDYEFVLRPPPTGSSSALTDLMISCQQMDGGELGCVVSSVQCPCLKKLSLFVLELEPTRDISISSESLEFLYCSVEETGKLEVHAPMLKDIDVSSADEARIVAPKLESVKWGVPYDPECQSIMLWICYASLISSTQLMERFDAVSQLTVSLSLEKGIAGYMTFLKEMDKLPICETLTIYFMANHHALSAKMFHLLRRCSCIRKLKLFLNQHSPSKITSCTVSSCPCLLPENYRLDDITFSSLEEIGINSFGGSDEQEEFMKLLLSKCNMVTLKRVDIMVPFDPVSSEIMEVVERIRSVCHPNSKVQFNVHAKPLAS